MTERPTLEVPGHQSLLARRRWPCRPYAWPPSSWLPRPPLSARSSGAGPRLVMRSKRTSTISANLVQYLVLQSWRSGCFWKRQMLSDITCSLSMAYKFHRSGASQLSLQGPFMLHQQSMQLQSTSSAGISSSCLCTFKSRITSFTMIKACEMLPAWQSQAVFLDPCCCPWPRSDALGKQQLP